jgi:hypothetical protein
VIVTADGVSTNHRKKASPFAARAEELAEWAWHRYVNRTDVWGGYNAIMDRKKTYTVRETGETKERGTVVTRPYKRHRGSMFLTKDRLAWHFKATVPTTIVGCHSTSPNNTSLFGALDVDQHGDDQSRADYNSSAALGWYDKLMGMGFHPLLTDSNGKGGRHLTIFLREPIQTSRMFWFQKLVVSDYAKYGLTAAPETFPKQSSIKEGRFGNWFRLPGLHHTRDHWSTVWNGSEWISGNDAADFMLSLIGDDPGLIPLDAEIQYRVPAYIVKLPHLSLGNGRDDVAYQLANFLVRDLAIPDLEALPWMEMWDAGNTPPKGRERLIEIIASSHTYGQKPYGSERSNNSDGDPSSRAKPSEWPDFVLLSQIPTADPFPDVLPATLQTFVEEAALTMNCPIDFAAGPMIALAGGAIGNSRHLAITRSHSQAPCLFSVTVAPPGAGKSPVLKDLRKPFDEAQRQYLEHWKREVTGWEEKEEGSRGPKPTPRRCIVSDITCESLVVTLDQNPRGVVQVKDELSGLITGFNQYKAGGNDRQTYLDLWSGAPILTDRKGDNSRGGAPLSVRDAFCAVVGNIQPAVLERMRGETGAHKKAPDDGFMDRWLFEYPQALKAAGETWAEISQTSIDAWHDVVKRLLGLSMVCDLGMPPRPFYVHLTQEGKGVWSAFTEEHADEQNADNFPPYLIGTWSKLKGYCARLGLIIHFLRWACNEVKTEDVDGESMERAVKLVRYYKSHARKVHMVMDSDEKMATARLILKWIVRTRSKSFQKRDAYQALKTTVRTMENLEPGFSLLERHYIIRAISGPVREGPGRPGSPLFDVHPRLGEVQENIEDCED